MVLHDVNQGLVVKTAAGDPDGELGVPDKGVAVDLEVVLPRVCGVAVGIRKGEVVARWLDGLPLHAVLRREGVEVGLHDLVFPAGIPEGQGSANELPSGLLHGLVKAVTGARTNTEGDVSEPVRD